MDNTTNWLVRHAITKAWQRPHQDGALNIRGCRIGSRGGSVGHVSEGMQMVRLPDENFWHVFHLGRLHYRLGNLNIPANLWTKVSACINTFSCYFQVYNAAGLSVPTHMCYLRKLTSGAILLAIPDSPRYKWIESEDVYIRIYPGWSGKTGSDKINPTLVKNFSVTKLEQRSGVVDAYNILRASNKGYVTAWINGRLVKNLTVDAIAQWDEVEIRCDGRVRFTHDFVCKDLQTFLSTIDSASRKYLLHVPKGVNNEWLFCNDVELEVYYGNEGRYYSQLKMADVRQLTFNDVSIPTEKIGQLRTTFGAPVQDIDKFVIRLIVREDCFDLPVLFNSDRITELYRLGDDAIINAMLGVTSTVAEWKASALETSPVNRLAASMVENITGELAAEAYGYNAVAHYAADTPAKLLLDSQGYYCELPYLLAASSTVYEYDVNGVLLEWRHQSNNNLYRPRNPAARLVEAIVGEHSDAVTVVDNAPDFIPESGANYSLWLRVVKSDIPTDEYHLAVEGTDYEYLEDGTIRWTVDRLRRHPTVVYDDKHLMFSMTFGVEEGELRFPIIARNNDGRLRTLWCEMETVEVWLNKHPLTQGIDYYVKWPEVVITNKVFISDTTTNVVDCRARGVTGKMRPPKCGFITSGLISNNARYDLKDDKVIRIVAGGSLLHRSDVVFREDGTAGTDVVADGMPFSIGDAAVPLRDLVEGSSYPLQDKARDLDDRIEDYMSIWNPTPPPQEVVPLTHYYHLYSPVLNKVIWDMKNGTLRISEDDATHRISTTQLDTIMERYVDLLPFDPVVVGYDKRFVKVHPHILYSIIDVTELQFALIDRINQRHLNGGVQINQYLRIKQG